MPWLSDGASVCESLTGQGRWTSHVACESIVLALPSVAVVRKRLVGYVARTLSQSVAMAHDGSHKEVGKQTLVRPGLHRQLGGRGCARCAQRKRRPPAAGQIGAQGLLFHTRPTMARCRTAHGLPKTQICKKGVALLLCITDP